MSKFKKLVSLALGAAMALSMNAFAFASEFESGSTYVALYKDGSKTEVSMSQKSIDGAATLIDESDEDFTIRIPIVEFSHTQMLITGKGYLKTYEGSIGKYSTVITGTNASGYKTGYIDITLPISMYDAVDTNIKEDAKVTPEVKIIGIPISMPGDVDVYLTSSPVNY